MELLLVILFVTLITFWCKRIFGGKNYKEIVFAEYREDDSVMVVEFADGTKNGYYGRWRWCELDDMKEVPFYTRLHSELERLRTYNEFHKKPFISPKYIVKK